MSSFAHSLGAVVRNSLRIEADHFRADLPHERATRLAKNYLELIEVETVSYCNRTCSFCPNQFIDRRSEKHVMPEHAWQTVLTGLRELDYDGTFVWSRYSEPLSERRILDRIREVRAAAPRCRICANTNGDYLNAAFLDELAAVGLNRLFVDLYMPDAETYDLDVAREYHAKFEQRIGKHCTL
ncbi:MAG TPA: radical SAM protein, partial [Gemmatimonadaceae bacterium]|nr:radical SAM protein [Gemmatimonadaceae bacterium]